MAPQTLGTQTVDADTPEHVPVDRWEQENEYDDTFDPSEQGLQELNWVYEDKDVYSLEVRLYREQQGGYSIYTPALPGVVSEGGTRKAAITAICEALRAAIESYGQEKQSIPWVSRDEQPDLEPGEIKTWITVDA